MMAFKYARLTASLVATTALGFVATQVAADLRARSEVRRIVAAHPGLKIKTVHAEPFGGRLVLEDIEAGEGSARHVSIERLVLTRPSTGLGLITSAHAESALDSAIKALGPKPQAAPPSVTPPESGGGAAPGAGEAIGSGAKTLTPKTEPAAGIPGTATAENVVITNGGATYRIKRVELTGTPLTNTELSSLLDLNAVDPLEVRLRKLNATSVAVPEILVDDPTAGSERHAAFSQILLSGVVAGRATAASVAGGTFELKTGNETTSGTIGSVQGFGVDFTQLAHVLGTVRKDDAEPILPIYDSVTVTGMKASNGKGKTFTVALLKETDLKARPLKTEILTAAKPGQKRSKAEDLVVFQDLARSVEIGTIELVDVAAHDDDPKSPTDFTLASVSVRGFGKARLGGASVRGVRLTAPKVRVALGGFELGPVPIAPDSAASTPTPVKADWEALEVMVEETTKTKEPLRLKMRHAGFFGEGRSNDIPTQMKVVFDNVVFDIPADSEQGKTLVDMGYRQLDLSAALGTTYDAGKQELMMRNLTLKGVDMGTLDLGLHLVNVTKGIASPKPEVQKAAAMAMLAKGVTLDLVNQGLIDRVITWKAKQDGQSVDAEKASIIEFFDKALPEQIKSANVKTIGSAVAKFVADPKKLHIKVVSKSGLGVGSMGMLEDPALLLDTLEVEARAN